MSTLLTEPNEEMLERICDAFCNRNTEHADPGVKFHNIHEFDVINHRFDGSIDHEGHTYGFVIQNGNWGGTEVLEWSDDPEDVAMGEIERPEPMTLVPSNPHLAMENPGLFAVYCQWRRETWFQDKVRGLNYDRHFAPGEATNRHYRDEAAKKGLTTGFISNMNDIERALVEESDAGKITHREIVQRLKTHYQPIPQE